MYEHLKVRPMQATLGAEVHGVDLKAPLDDDAFAEIESAWHTFAVLAFPGQHLDDQTQVAFSRRFGTLERNITQVDWDTDEAPEVSVISNIREDGTFVDPSSAMGLYMKGDKFWHTDSSFKRIPAKASILSARRIPSRDGETEFADMRAAYDVLDLETKRRLEDKVAVHSYRYSQGLVGGLEMFSKEELDALPPVQHRVTRTHPATGRKSLFIGRHASHIVGEDVEGSRRLLRDLCDSACRAPRVWKYRWAVGDVVIWDNRCVLHRACGHPPGEVRTMMRTTVAGDGAGNEWALR